MPLSPRVPTPPPPDRALEILVAADADGGMQNVRFVFPTRPKTIDACIKEVASAFEKQHNRSLAVHGLHGYDARKGMWEEVAFPHQLVGGRQYYAIVGKKKQSHNEKVESLYLCLSHPTPDSGIPRNVLKTKFQLPDRSQLLRLPRHQSQQLSALHSALETSLDRSRVDGRANRKQFGCFCRRYPHIFTALYDILRPDESKQDDRPVVESSHPVIEKEDPYRPPVLPPRERTPAPQPPQGHRRSISRDKAQTFLAKLAKLEEEHLEKLQAAKVRYEEMRQQGFNSTPPPSFGEEEEEDDDDEEDEDRDTLVDAFCDGLARRLPYHDR